MNWVGSANNFASLKKKPEQTLSFLMEVMEQIFHTVISLQINLTQSWVPLIWDQVVTAGF